MSLCPVLMSKLMVVCPPLIPINFNNPKTNEIIKNSRMITGTRAGIPIPDERTLEEVGISSGMVIEVIAPKESKRVIGDRPRLTN
jgi:hypothetical protein